MPVATSPSAMPCTSSSCRPQKSAICLKLKALFSTSQTAVALGIRGYSCMPFSSGAGLWGSSPCFHQEATEGYREVNLALYKAKEAVIKGQASRTLQLFHRLRPRDVP